MSLINKMLQDLEERRAEERVPEGLHAQVRVVPEGSRSRSPWLIAFVTAIPIVAAAAWFWGRPFSSVKASGPQSSARPQLALKLAPRLDSSASLALPEPEEKNKPSGASGALQAATETAPAAAGATSPDMPGKASGETHAAMPMPEIAAAVTMPSVGKSAEAGSSALPSRVVQGADKPGPASHAVKEPVATEARRQPVPARGKIVQTAVSKEGMPADENGVQGKPSEAEPAPHVAKQMKELTPQQRAENDYRRAGQLIQQQRSAEAITVLEQALQLDPLHAAARQTLAGLLVEAKRNDDAMRRLEEGLATDRTQAGLAMMLARLQVEKKELKPAIDTLQRTLPYAADQADYQAFLAALFQRDGRHKDAVEHYLLALRNAPQNGLWWMGLAISLQAENRRGDAREAYNRAKSSNMLSADLAMFVDQRLAQLR